MVFSESGRSTFEVEGDRRQGARPGLATMSRVPPDRAWWLAVGPRLDRGVKPCPPVTEAKETTHRDP